MIDASEKARRSWVTRRKGLSQNFWARVDRTEECWVWNGPRLKGNRYGLLQRHYHKVYAHRVSWEMHFGPIPNGLFVLHRCDNPPCVRPDHLFLGTQTDNMADMNAKGRHARRGPDGF